MSSNNNSNDDVRNIFTYFPVFPWYPFFSILYQPSDDTNNNNNNNNNNSNGECLTDQAKSFLETIWSYIYDEDSYVTRMKHLLMFVIYALAGYLMFIHKDNLNAIKPVLITLVVITLIVNFLFAWFSWWNELEMSDDYAKLPLFVIYSSFAVLFLLIYFYIRHK